MKLSVLQPNLKEALDKVSSVVPSRSTLPVLSNILLSTSEGRIKVVATNLEIAITAWCSGKIEEEGAIAIPGKLIASLISGLPSELVNLEVKNGRLVIDCEDTHCTTAIAKAEDYPPIPHVSGKEFEIEPDVLMDAIKRTVFAASTFQDRPILTAINWKADGKTLVLAGADGFRLAVCKVPCNQEFAVNIPASTLSRLMSLIKQEDNIKVVIGDTGVLFKLKNTEFMSQVIQGVFPNYEALVPTKNNTKITINHSDFARAITTANLFTREGSGIIKLVTGDKCLLIASQNEDIGDYKSKLDAIIEGEGKVALSCKYASDFLGACSEDKITLSIGTPSDMGIFRLGNNENYTYVFAPMFVIWDEK